MIFKGTEIEILTLHYYMYLKFLLSHFNVLFWLFVTTLSLTNQSKDPLDPKAQRVLGAPLEKMAEMEEM